MVFHWFSFVFLVPPLGFLSPPLGRAWILHGSGPGVLYLSCCPVPPPPRHREVVLVYPPPLRFFFKLPGFACFITTLVLLGFPRVPPWVFHGFPRAPPGFLHGFPRAPPWVFHGFPGLPCLRCHLFFLRLISRIPK